MDCSNNHCSSCIFDIAKKILILQKHDSDCNNYVGCDKPFLGPTTNNPCYNTRPIQLYNCCSGNTWSFDVTLDDGTVISSNVLRVESIDGCCCTFRVLTENPDQVDTNPYVATNSFFTMNLNCICCLRCLDDTFVCL